MKFDNAKTMAKQKNEDQLLIETPLESVRILKEEVRILRQENQKLLEKSQNTKEILVIRSRSKATLTKKNRTFSLRNKNGSRRRQANRTNQQKDSQEILPLLIKIPQLEDIQGTVEEKQRRSIKRINKNLCDNGWKNLQKENFPIEFQNSEKTE